VGAAGCPKRGRPSFLKHKGTLRCVRGMWTPITGASTASTGSLVLQKKVAYGVSQVSADDRQRSHADRHCSVALRSRAARTDRLRRLPPAICGSAACNAGRLCHECRRAWDLGLALVCLQRYDRRGSRSTGRADGNKDDDNEDDSDKVAVVFAAGGFGAGCWGCWMAASVWPRLAAGISSAWAQKGKRGAGQTQAPSAAEGAGAASTQSAQPSLDGLRLPC